MFSHTAGETVKSGYYWSRRGWRFEVVQPPAGVLPGEGGTTYVRVPLPLMIPLALLMGGGFVLFLPLIGFGVMAEWVYVKARTALRHRVRSTAKVAPARSTSRRG